MRKHIKEQRRGFTVMEAIVGFAILSLSLSGFAGMMVSSLRSFRLSQDKYIAAKIAQEGIELATNKKDNHVQCVNADPSCPIASWQNNLVGSFMVDPLNYNELRPQNQFQGFDTNKVICLKKAKPRADFGKFGYCAAEPQFNLPQRFTREVVISKFPDNNDYSLKIQSIVRWTGGKTLTLETILFSR